MTTQGTLRKPRAWLSSGGQINLLTCEVTVSRKQHAGTFHATMALDDPSNPGVGYWSGTAPMPASIIATNGDGGTKTLITGTIDVVAIDFDTRIVSVSGVDRTSELINTRNDQKYPDTTTSDVVSQVAGKHGLSVQTGGGGDKAGRTFDNQTYAFNSDVENDWDVVQSCADQDGKVCFVNGDKLYYVDPGNVGGGSYSIEYTPPTAQDYETGNFVKLRCTRDIQIAEGVQAEVASWNTRDKKAYSSASGSN